MKRTHLFLVIVAAIMLSIECNAANECVEVLPATPSAVSGYDCFFIYLKGTLGGDRNSTLEYDVYNDGKLTFSGYERVVRDMDFNTKTKRMTMKLYDANSGKYIGQLVGTVTGYRGFGYSPNIRYKGTFTNYKGTKLQFDYKGKFGDIE